MLHELEIATAKIAGGEAMLTALCESYQFGYSFGRVVERFVELVGVIQYPGLYQRLHQAGGLAVNNALISQCVAEGRLDGDANV